MIDSTSARRASDRRLLVYAHFDPDGIVQPYVLHSLRAMRPACAELRFVSTARLGAPELAKLDALVDERIAAENVGFDFAMWKRALRPSDPGAFDEIVLMNSSVYGPFRDAESLFDDMRDEPCDAWGITESLEHDRHVQSYFLVFRKSALRSPAFMAFWESVLPYASKKQVIRSYEAGLTQWLEGNGLTVAALCPWRQLVRYFVAHPERAFPVPKQVFGIQTDRRLVGLLSFLLRNFRRMYVLPSNPTVAYPRELLELGVPFLKLEVMRDNPYVLDLAPIRALLGSVGAAELVSTPAPRPPASGSSTVPATSCPICAASGPVLHASAPDPRRPGSPAVWNIRKCSSAECGCTWLDPRPLESSADRANGSPHAPGGAPRRSRSFAPVYGVGKRSMLQLLRRGERMLRLAQRREEHLLRALGSGPGRLLEVGCGDGSRLLELQQRGWAVEGQDVDAVAAAHARSKGLRVHDGDPESGSLPQGAFDVVLLSHVLERSHRPAELLRRCHALLKPGGRLVLSTPNAEGLGHRVFGRHWSLLDPPRHLVVHTSRSLLRLLRDAGFEEERVETVPLDAELSALHSRDIRYFGSTDSDAAPRIGHELGPVAFRVAAALLHRVAPRSGEELFATARNPLASAPARA